MLFCDVMRNLYCEIHTSECKDVSRARAKGFACGTVEGNTVEQAITNHIRACVSSGINLTRDCYRVMPCVKQISDDDIRNARDKGCQCAEIGADGTRKHNESSNRIFSFRRREIVTAPCSNHVGNYKKSPAFKEVR